MKVIAIANQKGGVGKTTTAVNLSSALARRGQRILLIDLDPQANATSGLGVEPENAEDGSIYSVLLGESTLESKIQSTQHDNLSIIPAEMNLAGVEIELARMEDHLLILQGILRQVQKRGIAILLTDHNVRETLSITDRTYILAGGRILAVGDLPEVAGAQEIDAGGHVLCPGFIDVHTHDDRELLSAPAMTPKVSQGVTTVVAGNCGVSLAPLVTEERPVPPLDLLGVECHVVCT